MRIRIVPFIAALVVVVYLSIVYAWWIGIAMMSVGFLVGYVKYR